MAETNGNEKNARLDRVEELLDRLAKRDEIHEKRFEEMEIVQEKFHREMQDLLRSQVLQQGRLEEERKERAHGEDRGGSEMTDNQLFVLAIAIVFPISVLIYQVGELRSAIRRSAEQLAEAIRERRA